MLFTSMPRRPDALAEETGSHPEPAGLIEYLWWDIAPSTQKFFTRQEIPMHNRHLSGDVKGWRSRLSDLGIVPTLTYVTDPLGNPSGGERHGITYFDNIGLNIDFDLEKFFGFHGSRFTVSGSWRHGTSLSNDYIGNIFNVQQVCCGATYKLVDLYWQQSFLDDSLNFRLGRLSAGDEFLASPLYINYVNNGFCGNPVGIFKNVPGMTAYPNATWGFRARVKPVKELYMMTGFFNNDATLSQDKNHGVDFSMQGSLFVIAETGYLLNRKRNATGLRGNYKIGGYYYNGDSDDLYSDNFGQSYALSGNLPAEHHGKWGFYILLDQMIYREGGPESKQGLTPFVSLLFAPDEKVNELPFFMNLGLVYEGLIPGRETDKATFGLVYGSFSHDLQDHQRDERIVKGPSAPGVQHYELLLELNYNIELTKWLHIQPDIQYVINPGGTGDIPDALVLGFQLSVNL